jgi:endonuclease/exonuclease/phosphatase family metal-dependent hydrolase
MLRKLEADLIFLQEVQDLHSKHRHSLGAKSGQMEFLADSVWYDHCYGKNAVYPNGHHGNAMLSKFPISQTHNLNISAHGSEQRGMLHAEIIVPNWDQPLHTLCVHLGLFAKWRRQQLKAITQYIQDSIPHNAPLILAGDFNDWGRRSGRQFALRLGIGAKVDLINIASKEVEL